MLFQYRRTIFLLNINKKIFRLVTNNKGFTFIESTLTLVITTMVLIFLPVIFMCMQNIYQQFSDIERSNYILFHQQLMTLYEESEQVLIKDHSIYFIMPHQQHEITIFEDKIIKKTKNNQMFKGYSPMLTHVKIKATMNYQHDLNLTIQQGKHNYEIKLTEKSRTSR